VLPIRNDGPAYELMLTFRYQYFQLPLYAFSKVSERKGTK
jgi:hypothetical protein